MVKDSDFEIQVRELRAQTGVAVNTLDRVRGIHYPRDQNLLPRPAFGANPEMYSREWFYQESGKITTDLLNELLEKLKKENAELHKVIEERVISSPEASIHL
jgi:hypothetical protein